MKLISREHSLKILLNSASILQKQLSIDSADLLINASNGNVRHAINTMQFMMLTKQRKRSNGETSALVDSDERLDLFSTTSKICNGVYEEKFEDITSSDIQFSLLLLHENGPSSARDIFACASSLNALSMTDILLDHLFYQQAISICIKSISQSCKGSKRIPKITFPSYLLKKSAQTHRLKHLKLSASVKCPTIGQLQINASEKVTSVCLQQNTLLSQISPPSLSCHDYLLPITAYAKGLKLPQLKQLGLFVDNAKSMEIIKHGAWKT
jgi:hypothetical protein